MENLEIYEIPKNGKLDKEKSRKLTGYPHIDKPWQFLHSEEANSAKVPQMTIYDSICESAQKYPNIPALIYFGKKITYKKLKEEIDVIASSFVQNGVKKGDIVTLLTANTPENTMALYALNKIGAVANMVDLTLKEDELLNKLKLVDSKIVLATDIFLPNLQNVIKKTNVEKVIITSPFDSLPFVIKQWKKRKVKFSNLDDKYIMWKDFQKQGEKNPSTCYVPYEKNRTACIVYTSGTTGPAKGVELTNDNFMGMAVEYKTCGLDFKPGEKLFNEEPPFLSYCVVLGLNLPLSLGVTIHIYPDYRPEDFADRVYAAKTEHILACPADYENFRNNPKVKNRDYSFIKTAASGGVGFNVDKKMEINEILNLLIVEGYGMTEGSSAMTTNVPQYNVLGTVGLPLPLTNMCIYDKETKSYKKYGEQGEICFSGPTIAKGYYNNPEATESTFMIHDDGQRWLHTGDIGVVNPEGGLSVVGRMKRVIIRYDGYNISPFEIEDTISESEYVEDCCVVNSPDKIHGEGNIPAAYVVLKDGVVELEKAYEDIKTICNTKIMNRNMPKKFVLVKELPLTKVKKIDYRKLEAQELEADDKDIDKGFVLRLNMNRN